MVNRDLLMIPRLVRGDLGTDWPPKKMFKYLVYQFRVTKEEGSSLSP